MPFKNVEVIEVAIFSLYAPTTWIMANPFWIFQFSPPQRPSLSSCSQYRPRWNIFPYQYCFPIKSYIFCSDATFGVRGTNFLTCWIAHKKQWYLQWRDSWTNLYPYSCPRFNHVYSYWILSPHMKWILKQNKKLWEGKILILSLIGLFFIQWVSVEFPMKHIVISSRNNRVPNKNIT